MYVNRITLDRFVYHKAAKLAIQKKLDELNVTDECITDLLIEAGSGYVSYQITLGTGPNKIEFSIYDSGTEVQIYREEDYRSSRTWCRLLGLNWLKRKIKNYGTKRD